MAVTQVASYEKESGQIAAGTSGNHTLDAAFTPAAGELIVVWWTGGSVFSLPTGAPATSGGVTWTQRHAVNPANSAPVFCWTGVAPANPTACNPAVPYTYTGTGSTAAHLVVQRFSGTTLPATPNTPASTGGGVVTTGAGGATLAVTQQAVNSGWTWIAADYNGVITGNPTAANADTLAQSLLFPTAGELADWVYWRVGALTGATAVGFSGFSTAGTRKLTISAIELPVSPAGTATSSRTATFDSGTIPASLPVAYGASVVNGRLRLQAQNAGTGATTFSGVKTADQPNGVDRFDDFYFQATQVTGAGGGNPAPSMAWVQAASQPAGTRIGWEYDPDAGTLTAKYQIGFVDNAGTVLTYAAATHAWWRVRNTGTQIVWETSTTGVAGSWTQRRTLATPAWANGADCSLSIEAYRTTGVSDFFEIDNVNVPGSVAGPVGTAVSGSRATAGASVLAGVPSSPARGADALQARTLTEVRLWEQWLSANAANGMVGEFGAPSVWARFGDQPQQDQWTALLSVYLGELDRAGLHSAVWASGRNWNVDYTLGLHTPNTVGGPLANRLATVATVAGHPSRNGQRHGIGLSGWEQGVATGNTGAGDVRPGTSYAPTAADFAFIAADGIDFVRLAMAWERLQPTLGGALDTAALSVLDGMLSAARANGISVLLDLHNYGRYTLANGTLAALGGGTLTSGHLADFWTRLITWVAADSARANTVVAVGIMNEPHDLPGGAATWQAASQAAVTAIRAAVS